MYVFSRDFFTVLGSMKLVKAKKFVMTGSQWRVEVGSYHYSEFEEVLFEFMAGILISRGSFFSYDQL